MVVRWNDVQIKRAREGFVQLGKPFLMRQYDASAEDFESLADEDFRCEYMDGILIVHSPATSRHDRCGLFLGSMLEYFTGERRLGRVFGPNTVMQLDERRFCPDLAFLAMPHLGRERNGRIIGPADLVVEVISPGTRQYDLGEKLEAYCEAGVSEIWLIDHERGKFHVVSNQNESINRAEKLANEDYGRAIHTVGRVTSSVVAGFWVDVGWFWSDPLPITSDCFRAITATTSA